MPPFGDNFCGCREGPATKCQLRIATFDAFLKLKAGAEEIPRAGLFIGVLRVRRQSMSTADAACNYV